MESETAPTHEEIWDDSALVESWNQALEEYKKYHSIHARGGTVDEIPNGAAETKRRNGQPETGDTGEPRAREEGAQEGGEEEGEVEETVLMDESDDTPRPIISDPPASADAKEQGNRVQTSGSAGVGPQTLLGTVQDEDLKKLLMSWYYAGYYTGLYEGKQQGLQQAEQARKNS